MVPIDSKKNIIVIDDLHLESNYNQNLSEFIFSWKHLKGYFDTHIGMFKQISNFSHISTYNTSMKKPDSWLYFYTNKIHIP